MARGSRWGACILILYLASVPAGAAERLGGEPVLGLITGSTSAAVNGQPLLPGAALFAGDVVRTGRGATALMQLRTGVSAALAAESEVIVERAAGEARFALRQGVLTLRSAPHETTRVRTLGVSTSITGEGGFPALCTIASVGKAAAVYNQRGRVEIHGAGAPLRLAPGKVARLEAGHPQVAGQRAGEVKATIPEGKVQHPGQTAEFALNAQDPVVWEDLVRTLKTGRVRIQLEDGTFLNVGARSQMRITRHDPATQQTQIELKVGRLRAEVAKLTKPGAVFRVHTDTAVIGVTGTIFAVLATPTFTRVWCIQGTVTVQNISGAIGGVVRLQPGQMTSVPRVAPPATVVRAPLRQVLGEVSRTSAGESLAPEMSQALQTIGATSAQVSSTTASAVTSAVQASTTATSAVTTAAEAATATVSGVAISRVDTANSSLDAATTALSTAQTTNAATATVAGTAATVAGTASTTNTAVVDAITTGLLPQVISPSQPCGCL